MSHQLLRPLLAVLAGVCAAAGMITVSPAYASSGPSAVQTSHHSDRRAAVVPTIGFAKGTVWQDDDIIATSGEGTLDTSIPGVISAITQDATDMQNAGVTWARWWVGPPDSVAQETAVASIFRQHGISLDLIAAYAKDSSASNESTFESWLSTMVPAMAKLGDNYWEIGNEPNISTYWNTCEPNVTPGPTPGQGDVATAVAAYVVRLKDAYTTIHEYDSNAFVASAGLSYDPTYDEYCEIPSDQWIAEFIKPQYAAWKYMDAIGIHPYAGSPAAVVSALTDTRTALSASSNFAQMPFAVTEVGFWANGYTPGSQNGYIGTDSEQTRAADYVTLMSDLKSYGINTPVFWYTWYDYSQPDGYGIVHYAGYTSRVYLPIYDAMKGYTA